MPKPSTASASRRRVRERVSASILAGSRRWHKMFFLALAAGLAAGVICWFLAPDYAVVLGAMTLFAAYLALVALVMPTFTGQFLKARAAEADMPISIIFGVVLVAVGVSSASLFMALNRHGTTAGFEVAMGILSVLLGWFTIHTMAALHYAYEYYEPIGDGAEAGRPARGLAFPDGVEPDGIEFLYFSYVIGVAFAVSDVQVHSRKMRRLVLIHSTFAYFFNTLILAATVNVAVAVGS